MTRKIFFNCISAFGILPLIAFIQFYLSEIKTGNWTSNGISYEMKVFFHNIVYFAPYFIVLFFIFLPFQLIKDFYQKKGRPLTFFRKVACLFCIVFVLIIIAIGTVYGMIRVPWWKNYVYLLFAILFAIVFATFFSFTIDRYVEKKNDNNF